MSTMTNSALTVNIVESGDQAIVRLKGDAGVTNTDKLDHALLGLTARRPKRVVFDLSDLVFISSLGLSVLLQVQRGIIHHGGAVRYAAMQGPVRDMIKKCRLDSVFELHDTVTGALESMRAE